MSRQRKTNLDTPKQIALITWVDSFYDDGVHTDDELASESDECLMHSVGFLVGETENVYKVSMDYGQGTSRHTQRIRKENVRGIQIIS